MTEKEFNRAMKLVDAYDRAEILLPDCIAGKNTSCIIELFNET